MTHRYKKSLDLEVEFISPGTYRSRRGVSPLNYLYLLMLAIVLVFSFALDARAQAIVPNLLWQSGDALCSAEIGITSTTPQGVHEALMTAYQTCVDSPGFSAVITQPGPCVDTGATGQGSGAFECPACITYYNNGLPPYGGCGTDSLGAVLHCPQSSSYSVAVHACVCPPQQAWSTNVGQCVNSGDKFDLNNFICQAPLSDPIYPLKGSKAQEVDLGFAIGGKGVKLTYDTTNLIPDANGNVTWPGVPVPSFGQIWQSSLHKGLTLQGGLGVGVPYSTALAQRGNSRWESLSPASFDTCTAAGGGSGGLIYSSTVNPNVNITFNGTGPASTLVDAYELTEETYDTNGNITAVAMASGGNLNYTYTSGLLTSVTDQYGRSVQFTYAQPTDTTPQRISVIIGTDGSTTQVAYDARDNLSALTWNDGNVRAFVYENFYLPFALTGIIDESGQRYSTTSYDPQGRAAGVFQGFGVERYSVTYASPPIWNVAETYIASLNMICREHSMTSPSGTQVTGPNAQVSNFTAGTASGTPTLTGDDQPAGSGCSASSSAQNFDANGNVLSHDDFDGNRSCYAYDTSRNLRIVSVDGLPKTKACPSALATYIPAPVDAVHPERKITTVWHPNWVLKTQEAEPEKITTWVYNGQPDLIEGGTAACAPSSPALPDGKPVAVLCVRYEQATTDTSGALGLSATVSGAVRKWSYSYNQFGQVLTATTPKQSSTDVLPHTTTYSYYAATSLSGGVGHTIGDLLTMTNPLGQVTTYTSYDQGGRLLSSTDANGTVTTQSYTPRGWLQTQTLTPVSGASLTTAYAYWPTGLLQTVTMPDGSALNYAYDTAHRLTDVTDGAGNKVHYVLDNSDNRTSQQVSDASGNLVSTVTRVFDALNRVQSVTGAIQ